MRSPVPLRVLGVTLVLGACAIAGVRRRLGGLSRVARGHCAAKPRSRTLPSGRGGRRVALRCVGHRCRRRRAPGRPRRRPSRAHVPQRLCALPPEMRRLPHHGRVGRSRDADSSRSLRGPRRRRLRGSLVRWAKARRRERPLRRACSTARSSALRLCAGAPCRHRQRTPSAPPRSRSCATGSWPELRTTEPRRGRKWSKPKGFQPFTPPAVSPPPGSLGEVEERHHRQRHDAARPRRTSPTAASNSPT
jgi:hypothetical protein